MAATQQCDLATGAPSRGVIAMLSRVPTPLGGLALGTASLGAAWSLANPAYAGEFKVISVAIASLMILSIFLKFFFNPRLLKADLSHPVVSSVMPTCTMGAMVISQSMLAYFPIMAKVLWLLAVGGHILLLFGFVAHRVREFRLEHMVPSWFIPPVGIINAALTSTGMGFDGLVHLLFIFGFVCYCIKLPVVFYRILFRDAIPDAALPTFTVLAAPASLSMAGYLTITDAPAPQMLLILAPLAIFMTGLVYLAFIRLLRLPFSPGYGGFTFPMVIGATALIKLTGWLEANSLDWVADMTRPIAKLELIIATCIVFYVGFRFALHYWFKPADRPTV